MSVPHFRRGDRVVYRMPKCSPRPGPRAQQVEPTPRGELYVYEVEKFWLVLGEGPGGTVELLTRMGKRHRVAAADPRLRRARWWELWLYRGRFPELPTSST